VSAAWPAVSVIVNVYRQSNFFRLCLQSLKNQTFKNFEVIIADDGSGSGSGIEEVVSEFKDYLNIKHIWQEDSGFRKALILNKAAKVAAGEKLFFIDGDILVHSRGVAVVSEDLRPGRYITSRVVRISKKLRDRMMAGQYAAQEIFSFPVFMSLTMDWLFGKTRFMEYGILLPEPFASFFQSLKKSRQVFGGCWAICKSDFEAVNGYDNSYVGYGHEDFDIGWRLRWAGVRAKLVTNRLVMFHLYHGKRQENLANREKKKNAELDGKIRCAHGLAEIKVEEIIIK